MGTDDRAVVDPELRVRGIDMLEGTPILDIKPYLSNVSPDRLRRGWLAEAEARVLGLAPRDGHRERRPGRIARGNPVGGDLEYADEVTMWKAMEGRREM